MIARGVDWIPRQQHVSVCTAAMPAGFTELEIVTEPIGQVARLVMMRQEPSIPADDFLKRNYVGIDLHQDAKDAVRAHAPIEPTALVHVVRNHTKTVRFVWMIRPGLNGLDGIPPLAHPDYRSFEPPLVAGTCSRIGRAAMPSATERSQARHNIRHR